MNVLAINGSPRKEHNTATLLKKALEGAASKGAKTELVHLYDINFKGCISCFECKLRGGKSYGKCAQKDGLMPVLAKIENIDALILGTPVYLGAATGEMRSFLERLVFPYLVYNAEHTSLFGKKIKTGLIYTMGANETRMKEAGYDRYLKMTEMTMARIFGYSESLFVTDTYQFDDYTKYVWDFNPAEKLKRHKEVFPEDCQKAFEMGVRLVQK